ncbi:MAG: hypothetical protein FJ249_05165 [Nitrospira sp.]|nr:hypothetical protein [Nitrospira sp.]
MSASTAPYSNLLRELASLMVAVAGESVTMVKRGAPDRALALKKTQEWDIYLEFLKILFNLADRLSVHYLPIKEQPLFMDSLEDTVTQQLQTVLAPALGPGSDPMEVTLAIGKAVASSRERYERFKFVVTEESKAKEEFLKLLAEHIAQLMGATGNGMVLSAATLCASSAIAAMKAAFEGAVSQATLNRAGAPVGTQGYPAGQHRAAASPVRTGTEIKLVSVMATVQGEEVETRWGLHPRFRQDLRPDEAQELTKLMNRMTQVLGQRFASVAFSSEWQAWQIGHA